MTGPVRVAERFKAARLALSPTPSLAEIARRVHAQGHAGFSAARASRLELGYADAHPAELLALAAALNVTPGWLAGVAEPPVAPPAPEPPSAPPATTTSTSTAAADQAPASLPLRGQAQEDDYRRLLSRELERARRELGRSGTSAEHWRSWRTYEQTIRDWFRRVG